MHGSPPPSDSEAGGSRSGSALFHPLPSWNKQMGSFFSSWKQCGRWDRHPYVGVADVISFFLFTFPATAHGL